MFHYFVFHSHPLVLAVVSDDELVPVRADADEGYDQDDDGDRGPHLRTPPTQPGVLTHPSTGTNTSCSARLPFTVTMIIWIILIIVIILYEFIVLMSLINIMVYYWPFLFLNSINSHSWSLLIKTSITSHDFGPYFNFSCLSLYSFFAFLSLFDNNTYN